MNIYMGSRRHFDNRASPGKIFIGGLAKATSLDTFVKYFGKYGEITDKVVMRDRETGRPRGFGFITYADPSVVGTVVAETHIINSKQVDIKRTIPKDSAESKELNATKIFVGGLPTSVTEDKLKDFFSNYGNVVEHEIIRDHETKLSRGFGFIEFDSEQVVDNILIDGNMIDMLGIQVEVKKAEPRISSNPGRPPSYGSNFRGHQYEEDFGIADSYSEYDNGGFGSAYRSFRGLSNRLASYGGYGPDGGGDFGGHYGGYGCDNGGYPGEPSLGYSDRFGSLGRGYGGRYGGSGLGGPYGRGGFGGDYGGSGLGWPYGRGGFGGGYGRYGGAGSNGEGYRSYNGAGSAGEYAEAGSGYGGAEGGLYRSRGGYSGSGSRYHPYDR